MTVKDIKMTVTKTRANNFPNKWNERADADGHWGVKFGGCLLVAATCLLPLAWCWLPTAHCPLCRATVASEHAVSRHTSERVLPWRQHCWVAHSSVPAQSQPNT